MNDFVGPGRFAGRTRPSAAPGTGTAAENIVVPAISGTPRTGDTITVDSGTWEPSAGTLYDYQWFRMAVGGSIGVDGVAIEGATNSSYILQDADIGQIMYCRVRADVALYAYANSDAVGPVLAPEYLDYWISTHRWMKLEDGAVQFDIPFTPENWIHQDVSDRFEYVNDMYIGVGTPNGYVLGTLPAPAAVGARAWSLSGADAAIFAIDSSTGEITLADAASVTAAGNLSITVTASDLGDYDITIPVVDDSSGVGFFDPDNGDDSNNGWQPHAAKASISEYASMGYPTTRCLRRGADFIDTLIAMGNNLTWKSFGDPSAERPNLYGRDTEIYVVQSPYKSGSTSAFQGITNATVQDLNLIGGAICQRPYYANNVTNGCTVKRVKASSNIDHNNSQGFNFTNVTQLTFRHCETENIYGDNLYGVYVRTAEIGFFDAPPANGSVADCIEFTDQQNSATRCSHIYIHNSILLQNPTTNSLKGAVVVEGTDRWSMEDCYVDGKYFGVAAAGSHATVRNIYVSDCRLPDTNSNKNNTWGIGVGNPYYNTEHTYHGNIVNRAARGITISGYNSPPPRSDMEISYNHVLNCFVNAFRATEAWCGYYSDNIHQNNASNSVVEVGNGATTATYTQIDVGAITRSDSTVTVSCKGYHYLDVGAEITIVGANETDYNGTWTVTEVPSLGSLRFDIGLLTPTTPATGAPKLRKDPAYATRDKTNNTSQSASGPTFTVVPTISGTCKEGEDVTITATAPAGSTLAYQWFINCKKIGSGDTSATLTIPDGASEMVQDRVPNAFGLTTPDLSVMVVATDGSGNKRMVPGIWPSGRVYEDIAPPDPPAPSAPVNTVAPAITGTLTVGETLSSTDGAWDYLPTGFEYQWQRDGSNIPGEITAFHDITLDDVGTELTCIVTATNDTGSTPATSDMLAVPISAVPDMVLWLDASDTSTVLNTSGAVDQWNDKSGSGNHATASGTGRPTTGTRTINSLNALDFDGTNDKMALPAALYGIGSGANTVYVVAAPDSATGGGPLIMGTVSGTERWGISARNFLNRVETYNGPIHTHAITPDTSQHIYGMNRSGFSNKTIYDAASSSGGSASDITVDSLLLGNASTNWFNGIVGAVAAWSRSLTSDEDTAIRRAMNGKWGTP